MKKLILILLLGLSYSAKAQILFDFNTAAPSSGVPDGWTISSITIGNTGTASESFIANNSISAGYTGASGGNNGSIAAKDGVFALGTSSYFEVTLSPPSNEKVSLSGIAFGMRSTTSGPTSYFIYSSLDNYAAPVASGAVTNNSTWKLFTTSFSSALASNEGSSLTLRIYGSGGSSASSGNWRIDDLRIIRTSTQPVSLISFLATSLKEYVRLSWTTAVEVNSKEFEILKSIDGNEFSSLGKVRAAGSSDTERSYAFIDHSIDRRAYYQLRQIDLDGKVAESEVIGLTQASYFSDFGITNEGDCLRLAIESEKAGPGEIVIFNVNGQRLASQKFLCRKGNNTLNLFDFRHSGLLIITVRTPAGIVTKKYLKS